MAKGKKPEAPKNVNDKLNERLASVGLADSLQLADQFQDMDVTCHSTGFPQLDMILHPTLLGLPASRDIEIFSKKESAGKTTLATQILRAWQQAGLLVGYVDIERTQTKQYFRKLGVVLDPNENPNIAALRIMRSKVDPKTEEQVMLSLEEILDKVHEASRIFDLLVVDSIDALVQKSEAEKTADQNRQQGGIAKKMSEFMRVNIAKKASIIWVNQTRQSMGFNPTGGVTYVTSGGRAIPFYSSVRLELSMVKQLKENEKADPYGFTTKVMTVKNKVSALWRNCELNYVFGEGFSLVYDYFTIAERTGIIAKSGAWYLFPQVDLKLQGKKKMYDALVANEKGSLDTLKKLVDGEDVSVEEANPNQIEEVAHPDE